MFIFCMESDSLIRKLYYNKETTSEEQERFRYHWIFAILNQPKEIGRIKERLYLELQCCDDFQLHYESLVPNSGGIHCQIFSFKSERGKIENPHKIYDSPNFKKDRDLYLRDETKWKNYVNNFAGRKIE